MTLASYIAFKSLRVEEDGLYSPSQNTRWDVAYVPALGRLAYSLRAPSLEEKQGVYGATYREATKYLYEGCCLFLVAPSPDPDTETELGTHGWRATCAVVLGEVTSLQDAARLVLASHQAGYPQVEGILEWAKAFTQRPPWTAEKVRRVLACHAPRLDMAKVFGQWVVFDKNIGLAHSARHCGKYPKDVLATVLDYYEAVELVGVIGHHE